MFGGNTFLFLPVFFFLFFGYLFVWSGLVVYYPPDPIRGGPPRAVLSGGGLAVVVIYLYIFGLIYLYFWIYFCEYLFT